MTAIISKDGKYVLQDEVDDMSEPDMVDLGTWFYGADFGVNDHGRNIDDAIINELFDGDEEKYEKFWHTGIRLSHAWWNRLRAQAKKQGKRIALILCPSNHNNQDFRVVENKYDERVYDYSDDGIAIYSVSHDSFLKGHDEYKSDKEWLDTVKTNLSDFNAWLHHDIKFIELIDNQTGKIVDYLGDCIFDPNTSDKENLMAWLDDFEVGDNRKPEDWSYAKQVLRFVSDDKGFVNHGIIRIF